MILIKAASKHFQGRISGNLFSAFLLQFSMLHFMQSLLCKTGLQPVSRTVEQVETGTLDRNRTTKKIKTGLPNISDQMTEW